MDLYVFHRILIGAAILFDIYFTTFCIRRYNVTGDRADILWAVISSVIVVGFVVYLVIFNRKTARLREKMENRILCPQCGYDLRGSTDPGTVECPECGRAISDELKQRAAAV